MVSLLAFLKSMRYNRNGNFYLGLFLFFHSFYWIENVLHYFAIDFAKYHNYFTNFLNLIEPILLFISVNYFTKIQFSFSAVIKHLYFPTVLFVAFSIATTVYKDIQLLKTAFTYSSILFTVSYTILSFTMLQRYQKSILNYASNLNVINLQWLKNIAISIIIILLLHVFNVFIESSENITPLLNLASLCFIFYALVFIEKQVEIYPLSDHQKEDLKKAITYHKKQVLSDETIGTLKKKLSDKMSQEQLFLDHDLNLIKLAEHIDIPAYQLSYLINKGFHENFSSFVNKYRIEYAKDLFLDKQNKYSILGIALESGFSSKTAFYTTFKKYTNLTPSEFKKLNRF